MSRGGFEQWDDRTDGRDADSQPRRARRRPAGRIDEQQGAPRADDAYGYGGSDGSYGREYAGDSYQDYRGGNAQDGYAQDGYPQDGYSQGSYPQDGYAQDGYAQDGYAQDGYAQDGYARDGYAQDGYAANGYRDSQDGYSDGYRGADYRADGYGGRYADDQYGRDAGYDGQDRYPAADPYGSADSYSAGDTYAAADPRASQDPYAAEPYGGGDPYGGRDSRDSGPYGRTDPRGTTDPRAAADPFRRGRDPYAPADEAGYGGEDRYGGQTGYEQGDGYGAPADRYWVDPADEGLLGGSPTRRGGGRSGGRGGGRGPDDDSRHESFFRGFGQDDDVDSRRRTKEHHGHGGLIALAVLLVIVGGIAGAGYHYYSEYKARHASYTGSGFGTVTVIVKSGDSADDISEQLLQKHVIAAIDPWASYVANKTGLQPGEFKLHEHMSPAAAWALLMSPKAKVNSTVTIPDGLRESKILPLLAKESGLPLSQFQTAIKDVAALGLPSYANGSPEGYLYPDTYDIVPGSTTALAILQEAVKQFNTEATSLHLLAGASTAELTPTQVITEASLLEAEVGPKYYADVARVIDNRLNQGMDLQLDSTVAYVTDDYNYNFTQAQLNTPSTYNTFLHSDLPPGPIDSPDAAAIEAVLNPAPSSEPWLYFVTVNKAGLTYFTASNTQFQIWSNQAKAAGV
jgi:UPF0755 protein